MIKALGGEGEESRERKGFTEEVILLVVSFEGQISRESKKGHSDERNSIGKGTEVANHMTGLGKYRLFPHCVCVCVFIVVLYILHIYHKTTILRVQYSDIKYVYTMVSLSGDGRLYTSAFFKLYNRKRTPRFGFHCTVFKGNSSTVHMRDKHFALLKLVQHLTSARLRFFLDNIDQNLSGWAIVKTHHAEREEQA